jgi:hypothetical protein
VHRDGNCRFGAKMAPSFQRSDHSIVTTEDTSSQMCLSAGVLMLSCTRL